MVDLFLGHVLVKNNKEQDELDTEREIVLRLQNRVLLLLFAVASSESCRQFASTLKEFITQLTDEFYVERSVQLALLYVSLDDSEEEQEVFLKELPKRCLYLPYEDPYRSELKAMFGVEDLPTVVVLRPDCSVLVPNAVEELRRLGPDCFRNWQEAAELIDRNFLINEDFDEKSMRSFSDPVRRLKYKVEDDRKKKRKRRSGRGRGDAGEEEVKKTNDDGGGAVPW